MIFIGSAKSGTEYTELERRVLRAFITANDFPGTVMLPPYSDLMVSKLVEEGLIERIKHREARAAAQLRSARVYRRDEDEEEDGVDLSLGESDLYDEYKLTKTGEDILIRFRPMSPREEETLLAMQAFDEVNARRRAAEAKGLPRFVVRWAEGDREVIDVMESELRARVAAVQKTRETARATCVERWDGTEIVRVPGREPAA